MADPVLIMPTHGTEPSMDCGINSQNRSLRAVVTLDPNTGAVLKLENFDQWSWVDRLVGIAVAAHEGQLFGVFNQLLGLFPTAGFILLSVSSVLLGWRRRRHVGVLEAPSPARAMTFSWTLPALPVGFGIYLPMLGSSLVVVLSIKRFVLRRMERWNIRWA